jgi:hypothetical protein
MWQIRESGELIAEAGEILTLERAEFIERSGVNEINKRATAVKP